MGSNERTKEIYGYYSLVSSGDIVEMANDISSSALSNRKVRDSDFPKDMNDGKGAPLYYYGEVLEWAYAHNILINGRQVFLRDIEIMKRESENSTLNVAITGRSRGGKSFISAYFMENTVFMRRILSGGGSDYTQIPTKITIDGSSPCFRFSVGDCFVKDERVKEILQKDDAELEKELKDLKEMGYVNQSVAIDENAPDFEDALLLINGWLRKMHDALAEKEIGYILDQNVALEIATKPSKMSENIMTRTGKKSIVVLDTPGVSGNYMSGDDSFDAIGRQDVVIIVLRDDNLYEFDKSYERIAELVGTNTVVFSYTVAFNVTEEDEFEDAQKEGERALAKFGKALENAFGNGTVIGSKINALHPCDHCVVLPTFKKYKYSEVERKYEERLENLIVDGFGDKITTNALREALIIASKNSKEPVSVESILELLGKIIYVPELTKEPGYESRDISLGKFKENTPEHPSHARVKTQDGSRIHSVVNRASKELLTKNLEKLKECTLTEYDKEWEQKLIQYVYQVIDRTIKSFPGVGNGNHPFEDPKLLTMRACESVLAKELYEVINEELDKLEQKRNEDSDYEQSKKNRKDFDGEQRVLITRTYRQVLKDNGISSKSWDRVTANPYEMGSLKTLVESGILDFECADENELIINSAVMGLYFRTIVDIYTDVLIACDGYKNLDDTIERVKKVFKESGHWLVEKQADE